MRRAGGKHRQAVRKSRRPRRKGLAWAVSPILALFIRPYERPFGIVSVAAIPVLAALSGCSNVDVTPPRIDTPDHFAYEARTNEARSIQQAWWTAFNDKALSGYIEKGLAQSPQLQQARAKVDQAKANVGLANSSLLPSLSTGAGVTRGDKYGFGTAHSSKYSTLSADWMVDLFGGKRASKRAAEADLASALSSKDQTEDDLVSSIASAYVDIRYYQKRIDIARSTVANRKQNLDSVYDSRDAGEVSNIQVVNGKQLVAQAEATLPSLEVQLDSTIATLAELVGESVNRIKAEVSHSTGQPIPRYKIGAGVPANVIRNRPDVRIAESNFASAAESVGVAKAAFYPSLDLSGYLTPTKVLDTGHVNVWLLSAGLSAPIFDGGKNKANLASAKAKLEEARAAWRAAVLSGISDIERALAAYNKDGANIAAQRKLVATSQESVELGRVSFQLGADPISNVLNTEKDYLAAQEGLSDAIRQQALHYITLCKEAPADRVDHLNEVQSQEAIVAKK
ncbi:efflux transporter outer membrane subunit [Agrobacterium sp. a22-2]|uniref:efflux transporter outer membrane subunit n=1 Tax=Agrobacterium sp. a22-2 TaxID=2283840 RepID=UPI0014477BDC|nr:efflux transporter outer membrane subunit [Agrobacterium sp. a22-2]NKN37922.1 efflux transporter outer membrane subunit [Agrobacterium sp. a22-2]